jgi:GrpB-like predicted nucleotidyltransferase (UPF0157 family)
VPHPMKDAPIEIVEYQLHWPAEFEREQAAISQALAPWLVATPEHIGSTAVPGLAAKPVIDIMAPVASLDGSIGCLAAATRIGYVHFPYKPDLMHWFCKPSPEHRTHHLHLVPANSRLWVERLAFRNALRSSEKLRMEYQELKCKLAEKHRGDREAYTEAKSPFIQRVVRTSFGGGNSAA